MLAVLLATRDGRDPGRLRHYLRFWLALCHWDKIVSASAAWRNERVSLATLPHHTPSSDGQGRNLSRNLEAEIEEIMEELLRSF